MYIGPILFILGILIEGYYWFIWFPKNWKSNTECSNLVHGIVPAILGPNKFKPFRTKK